MTTHSDATAIRNDKEKIKKPRNVQIIAGGFQQSNKIVSNSAIPISGATNSNSSDVDWNNFHKIFNNPAFSSPQNQGHSKKQSRSTFNFHNCTVENAVIGAKKPVTINNKEEIYKKGAQKNDITIKDGNFPQANIGGHAEYNTENSSVSAGSVATNKSSGKFVEIDDCHHPFSPEQYLAKLLKTGITSSALTSLLEKKYSIVELAYVIPNSKSKQERMVETLLDIADLQ